MPTPISPSTDGRAARMRRAATVTAVASLVTLGLKVVAYAVTGSMALLSEAAEGLVNVVAALLVVIVVRVANKPADEEHPYGHEKAEFFSAGVEGGLILLAAVGVIYSGIHGLLHPSVIRSLDIGLVVALAAALVNGAVAVYLGRVGRETESPTLAADAVHLWSDVATSVGVLVGLLLVRLTALPWLDPLIAIAVGLNILRTGIQLGWRSAQGLMDRAMPADEMRRIGGLLDGFRGELMGYHAIRTRHAGPRRFIDAHLVVDPSLSVGSAHDLTDRIELGLERLFPGALISLHIEPHVPGQREGYHLTPGLHRHQRLPEPPAP